MRIRSMIFLLFVLVAVVPTAWAHRPDWGNANGLMQIENIRTSLAFYRTLSNTQVDIYTFDARAGEHLHAGINIPAVHGLEAYGVTVALFGPGLPPLLPGQIVPDHPDGLGGVVFPSQLGKDFFEPFTQTNYWGRQRLEIDLPQTGTYYLLVWPHTPTPGKYVLDTGTVEVFGPTDLLVFPIWWVQVHLFFGHGVQLFAAACVLVLMPAVFIARQRLMPRFASRPSPLPV